MIVYGEHNKPQIFEYLHHANILKNITFSFNKLNIKHIDLNDRLW